MEASRLPDEHRDAAAAVRAVVDALASVVHAERGTLELVVVALVAEGHVLIEDVPGVGKTLVARTLARAVDCSFSRLQFTPGPAALGRDRHERLRPALGLVHVPAGSRLREPGAGRRDQPRVAAHPGGPARVHGGGPGQRGRRDARPRAPVHGARDPEPGRARGHVPAARGAARSLPAARLARLPAGRARRRACSPSRRPRAGFRSTR